MRDAGLQGADLGIRRPIGPIERADTFAPRATHRWSLQTNGRRVPTRRSATERRCSWGRRSATVERMTVQRMDHVGTVVDDLAGATFRLREILIAGVDPLAQPGKAGEHGGVV